MTLRSVKIEFMQQNSDNSRVDGFVRFKVEGDLLLLAFVGQDRSDEQDQAVWWNTIVQFQPLLSASDRGQHGQSVDPGLDVRRSTIFLRQHGGDTGDLILGIKASATDGREALHVFFGTPSEGR